MKKLIALVLLTGPASAGNLDTTISDPVVTPPLTPPIVCTSRTYSANAGQNWQTLIVRHSGSAWTSGAKSSATVLNKKDRNHYE